MKLIEMQALESRLAQSYLEIIAAQRGASLLREGQTGDAEYIGHTGAAPARQPNEERAAQRDGAQAAVADLPASSSPNVAGGGLQQRARTARRAMPSPATPQLDDAGQKVDAKPMASSSMPASSSPSTPHRIPRGLEARSLVQSVLIRSVFDTFKVRDGRAIGDLLWHELKKLAQSNEREARILRTIEGAVANAPSEAKVRDVVSVRIVAAAIAKEDSL
ncbi:MAG: hypothetical protein P4M05_28010 [Bradyrhizobium sp.]|nr:hypothetical protein [Bradyrhizobium sp.]